MSRKGLFVIVTLALLGASGCGSTKVCDKEICAYIVADSGQAGLKVRSTGTEDGVQWGTVYDDTQIAVECKLRTGFTGGQENDVWLRMRWSNNTETTAGGDSSAQAEYEAYVHSAYTKQTADGEAPDCED